MIGTTVEATTTRPSTSTPTTANHVFTVASLFSGMGGFLGGAISAGFQPTWANDNDPDCAATINFRFPQTRFIHKPIQELTVQDDQLEPVNLLVAGFPCQSFSIGGRRAGFDDIRHSCAPFVIPAQAGIQTPPSLQRKGARTQ